MFFGKLRYISAAVFLLLLAFTIKNCVPEKAVESHSKLIPMFWVNESVFIVRQGAELFRYGDSKLPEKISSAPPPIADAWDPQLPILPSDHKAFYNEGSRAYVTVNGEKHRVENRKFLRQNGFNQLFPPMKAVPFQTYAHLGKTGILTVQEGKAQKIELNIPRNGNWSGVSVVKDDHSKRFFAFQANCYLQDNTSNCQRNGWWLSQSLEVLSTVILPEKDLLYPSEDTNTFSCFSCGCSCYTQENVYAVDGNIYFHIAGFPLSNTQRGLYKVNVSADGTTSWEQVIRGRIEPLLSFSPSGCKVAYMKVSRFGDKIDVTDLCQ